MSEYLAAGRQQQAILVPEAPALYLWQVDYRASPTVAARRFSDAFPGGRRSFDATVGPYARVHVSDWVAPLGSGKTEILKAPPNSTLYRWLQELVSELQRPLYVGITGNLLGRVRQHVELNSRLREYLVEANVRLEHCALSYFPVPLSPESLDELAPEIEDQLDLIEDEVREDEEEDWKPSSTASAPASDIVQTLRLAEALVIRLAQPYLNRKLE